MRVPMPVAPWPLHQLFSEKTLARCKKECRTLAFLSRCATEGVRKVRLRLEIYESGYDRGDYKLTTLPLKESLKRRFEINLSVKKHNYSCKCII